MIPCKITCHYAPISIETTHGFQFLNRNGGEIFGTEETGFSPHPTDLPLLDISDTMNTPIVPTHILPLVNIEVVHDIDDYNTLSNNQLVEVANNHIILPTDL